MTRKSLPKSQVSQTLGCWSCLALIVTNPCLLVMGSPKRYRGNHPQPWCPIQGEKHSYMFCGKKNVLLLENPNYNILCVCFHSREGNDILLQNEKQSKFKYKLESPQFSASGEVGSVCAVNLLHAAVKESVKLDVKVDISPFTLCPLIP